jgi:hypothetical protein
MKDVIFWDVSQCNPIQKFINVSQEFTASIFRVAGLFLLLAFSVYI